MPISTDTVGQSARESTREMNVASLCFLPTTEGVEGCLSHFFLLPPHSIRSHIIFVVALQKHELDQAGGQESQRRLGQWGML